MENKIKRQQTLLSLLSDAEGRWYYEGRIDGIDGPKTQEGAKRFLKDYGFEVQTVTAPTETPDVAIEIDGDVVRVFSLAEDGEKYVSEHSQVKEYACNDGSDVVLIHPKLPDTFEEARKMVGPFRPNSAYRTVSYNATLPDASEFSMHCWGFAMDIPKGDSTPEELYAHFDPIVGDQGGLGIYDWGIHVDWRGEKARWDKRTKK